MNNISKIQNKIISANDTILHALKMMDGHRTKLLFVVDGDKFDCILTIGDIQRAIIRQANLNDPVLTILDRNKIYASDKDPLDKVKEVMFKELIDCMPVLNDRGEIVDVLFWHDVFSETVAENRPKIDLPVVIMAGGKGTRLKPLTNVIPKPLVPVGDKTILEVIMDQFEAIGCHKFYMSVNYKADMMKYYLSQLPHQYDIEFFMEDKPLGTIGSVSLLKGKINTPFFVSNCDSINEQDYRDVYDYHVNNHNDMTIVTMVKSFKIPYGVIETGEDGLMVNLK
jgi:CBS domain-containing protein